MFDADFWVLFSSGFLSATLLPGNSEILLLGFLMKGAEILPAWISVTSGNTLGAVTSFLVGALLRRGYSLKFATVHQRSGQWVQKYGMFVLLFSWVPVIGDPLVLAAGFHRLNFMLSLLFVFVGKSIRYFVLVIPFLS
ncbi:putative membrane protein [Gynuella sunshinyii YC6258]|uniref:Putative membrane protein n=2 Tax=Gynuella sunshinyii TaxID=1445505 RepID=A0A0C5VNQ2_9GAMM|nr:putative membrane protein [Gynuella sunshinyii YC6258]